MTLAIGAVPLAACASVAPPGDGHALTITLEHGSDVEERTKNQLLRLLAAHDIDGWIFTRRVHIDESDIPHSHPVLTLHARHLGEDEYLLSTFIHEQLHWFVSRSAATDPVIADLRARYPEVPVGYPDGARDEGSTYLHLVVCSLEREAMAELIGPEDADHLMRGWGHYRWIYATIIEDRDRIAEIMVRHGMRLPERGGS